MQPWRVQYRRLGGAVERATLKSLNDELLVNAQGTYELVGASVRTSLYRTKS